MKVLWAAIALFAFVQAKSYQGGWGNNYGRGNNPGRGPPWVQQNYPDVDVEWVCHSQKTSDMVMCMNVQENSYNRTNHTKYKRNEIKKN